MKSNPKDVESSKLTLTADSPLTYSLPKPSPTGKISVEEALSHRRSHREFTSSKIKGEEISQLLWAAYGITKVASDEPYVKGGYRTTPSAGAVYPLIIYLLANNVKDIENGVYSYNPTAHSITRILDTDINDSLIKVAFNQQFIKEAPANIIICAQISKMTERYGEEFGAKFCYMEAGHSAQNVYLQAEALHLGTCSVGAISPKNFREILKLKNQEEPIYIMPIGKYFDK